MALDTTDRIAHAIEKRDAEIERLRAALTHIVLREDSLPLRERNEYELGYKHGTEQCAMIAKDALGHEQRTEEK